MFKLCKLDRIKPTKIANVLIILVIIWSYGAFRIMYSDYLHAIKRRQRQINHYQQNRPQIKNKTFSINKTENMLPATCGKSENIFVAKYGELLDPPIYESRWRPNYDHDVQKAVTRAYGCSMNKKYCLNKPKSIPCCTKIIFDIWHKLDKYLTKYDVDYSLRWGSLLFAVRNGAHMPWDGRDIDIGFMRPEDNAKKAIDEFLTDYNVTTDDHHIIDVGSFFELHHQEYGYPDSNEEHCFVNDEFSMEFPEYKHAETLELAGNFFFDYGVGTDGAEGIDLEMKHQLPRIPINYDGSNGMKPPRKMYAYPDYYKHLNAEYGDWEWFDVIPSHISEYQIQYHGLNKENMQKYWEEMKRKTVKALGEHSDSRMFV